MGGMFSRCRARGSAARELGVLPEEEYAWPGLPEDRIEAYTAAREKFLDGLRGPLGAPGDGEDDDGLAQAPPDARELLKTLLVRRAMGLVHALKPIEEQRKGLRRLQSQGCVSRRHWESYRRAEEACAAEVQAVAEESARLVPEAAPNALIQTAVRLYQSHGLNWPPREGQVGEPRPVQDPPKPFEHGQEVKWAGVDHEDVDEDEVGEVVGGFSDGSVRVRFKRGFWPCSAHELVRPDGAAIVPRSPHPDAREIPATRIEVVLERVAGEPLGLALAHEPPVELRRPGQQSCLVVQGVLPEGCGQRRNQSQETQTQRLHAGDRIIAVIDGSIPKDLRAPVAGDSNAMLALLTKDQDAGTPLILLVARALGPPLRFRVGQRVEAHCGAEGWQSGVVVGCWQADGSEAKAPYVVRVQHSGRIVSVPRDSDDCIGPAAPSQLAAQGASTPAAMQGGAQGGTEKAGRAKRDTPSDGWAKGLFGKPKGKSKAARGSPDEAARTDNGRADGEAEASPTVNPKEAESLEEDVKLVVHPEAHNVPTARLNVVLKRDAGERLGIALNHEPPVEMRHPGQQSNLVISKVMPEGFVPKYNSTQQHPPARLIAGDRIVGVMDGSLPEKHRKPVAGDSIAMLELITRDSNKVTPLIFFLARPLGPPLRFIVGQRVKAQCGSSADWQGGTVVKCWEQDGRGPPKPYIIRLESGRVVAAPRDSEDCVVKADPRFKAGDVVMANAGPVQQGATSYVKAAVLEVGGGKGAYHLRLADGSEHSVAVDVDQFIRPVARFRKGMDVLAKVGSEYVAGRIDAVYGPTWVYAIKVSGERVVMAPEDTDSFVKRACTGEEVD